MFTLFFFAVFAVCERRKTRRSHSSINDDYIKREFREKLNKIADTYAKRAVRRQYEHRHHRQTDRIFQTSMMSRMGIPWQEMLGADPDLVDRIPSMFVPNMRIPDIDY